MSSDIVMSSDTATPQDAASAPHPNLFAPAESIAPATAPKMQYEYDLFISCAPSDVAFVEQELLGPMRDAGVKFTWEDEFQGGVDLTAARAEAIEKSRHTLVVLTPAWCESGFAKEDALTARFDDPGATNRKILPLLCQACEPPQQLRLSQLKAYDFSIPQTRQATLTKLLTELGQSQQTVTEVIEQFKQGLHAFAELMSTPEVRSAVIGIETAFKAANEQMGELSRCKNMHEYFHRTDEQFIEYKRLREKLQGLFGNCHVEEQTSDNEAQIEEAWFVLDSFINDKLASAIDSLVAFARSKPFRAEQVLWVDGLVRARNELVGASERHDVKKLNQATARLSNILGIWPSRFDQQLLQAVKNLQLLGIVSALESIGKKAAEVQFQEEVLKRLATLSNGIAAMSEFSQRIQDAVLCHNCLQYIDDILRTLAERCSCDDDIEKTQDAWLEIEPTIRKVLPITTNGEWREQLESTSGQLGAAIGAALPGEIDDAKMSYINRVFMRFRGTVRTSFTRVDLALLQLCDRLEQIQIDLNAVIRNLQNNE